MKHVRGMEKEIIEAWLLATVGKQLPTETMPVNQFIPDEVVLNHQQDDKHAHIVRPILKPKPKRKKAHLH